MKSKIFFETPQLLSVSFSDSIIKKTTLINITNTLTLSFKISKNAETDQNAESTFSIILEQEPNNKDSRELELGRFSDKRKAEDELKKLTCKLNRGSFKWIKHVFYLVIIGFFSLLLAGTIIQIQRDKFTGANLQQLQNLESILSKNQEYIDKYQNPPVQSPSTQKMIDIDAPVGSPNAPTLPPEIAQPPRLQTNPYVDQLLQGLGSK